MGLSNQQHQPEHKTAQGNTDDLEYMARCIEHEEHNCNGTTMGRLDLCSERCGLTPIAVLVSYFPASRRGVFTIFERASGVYSRAIQFQGDSSSRQFRSIQ